MAGSSDDNNSLALFCDFENIALGVRDAKYQKFDISHILEKLLVKGSIVVKKAYCDWERYKDFKVPMHEASFELIDIPHVRQSGKNSADIRMVVDALDLCYTKAHVDTFVIISGDSDFSPLVSKLRENAKTVIGVGVKNSTSDLLINNCDEFIYYDDLVRELERKRPGRKRTKKRAASRSSEKVTEDVTAQTEAESPAAATGQESDGKSGKGAEAASDTAGSSKRKRGKAAKTVEPAETVESLEVGDDDGYVADETSEELIQEGLELLLETAADLSADRDGNDKLWGSMVKQTLKRRRPGFNESYYGFESFGKMLEEAQARGYLTLELDDRSGGYIIRKVTS
ncbi:NYN domain-containing protein [Granulosicoccus sp. 3-233]|uniref:NYN domain-containing protein n=1 Tax=Granulosicoccus sp. 3-233 TaxID=3417969 RepID=UPI003D341A8A